jgi:hypothetical protein
VILLKVSGRALLQAWMINGYGPSPPTGPSCDLIVYHSLQIPVVEGFQLEPLATFTVRWFTIICSIIYEIHLIR